MITAIIFFITLVIPFLYLMPFDSNFNELFRLQAPNGQGYYLASKIIALTAFILLWWQLMIGLIGSTITAANANKKQHIILGLSLLVLVLLHVFFFFTAVSQRSGEYAFHILLPNFFSGYYSAAVSIGIVALLLMLFSIFLGFLKRKNINILKHGHKLVFVVFALVIIHTLMIGSESQSGLFLYMVYFSVTSILSFIAFKLYKRRTI